MFHVYVHAQLHVYVHVQLQCLCSCTTLCLCFEQIPVYFLVQGDPSSQSRISTKYRRGEQRTVLLRKPKPMKHKER